MTGKAPVRIIDLTLRDGEQAAASAFPAPGGSISRALWETSGCARSKRHTGHEPRGGRRLFRHRGGPARHADHRLEPRPRRRRRSVGQGGGAQRAHRPARIRRHAASQARLGEERALDELRRVLSRCRELSLEAVVGAEDASRADIGFLCRVYEAAVESGAIRLRYADTLGAEDPFTVLNVMRYLSSMFEVPIEYHAHNDFGLATANALAALQAEPGRA